MCILPGIIGLLQHLKFLKSNLNCYRPERCPNCGKTGLHFHGFYYRKSDRNGGLLNPIPIPRFFCSNCKKTTSILPECLAPHRWYMWYVQQAVLLQILLKKSFNQVSQITLVGRSTCRRWWNRLKERYLLHGSTLRNYYPELGYHKDFNSFWCACLQKTPLSKAMLLCNQSGVVIP